MYVIMMRCIAEELVAGTCQLIRAADIVGTRPGGRFHVTGDQLLRRCWINDSTSVDSPGVERSAARMITEPVSAENVFRMSRADDAYSDRVIPRQVEERVEHTVVYLPRSHISDRCRGQFDLITGQH